MNEVIAEAIAAVGVVAPGVDRADVAGLQRDVVDFIELNEVVVAVEEDCAVRMVVDEVVRGPLADAADQDGRHVAFGPAALAREMTILDEVSAGAEGLTVAAIH